MLSCGVEVAFSCSWLGCEAQGGEEGARTRLEAGWCAADGERVAVSREFEGGALAAVRFVRERRVGGAP